MARNDRRDKLRQRDPFGGGQDAIDFQQMDEFVFQSEKRDENEAQDDIRDLLPSQGIRHALQARNGRIQRGNFVLTMTGLEYNGDELTLQEWREMGMWLNQLKDSIQWMIGDWANMALGYVDTWTKPDGTEFETRYAELLKSTDYSYSTLRKFASVAAAVPVFRRRNTLTFSHHVEVARLPDEAQERFLDLAEPNEIREKPMPIRELRERIQSEFPPELPDGSPKPDVRREKDNEAELLQLGLMFVRKPPKRNSTNRKRALEAAELYRQLAQKLEAYANDND